MSSDQYQTIKIRKNTHRALKVLAAKTGESMLDLIDRLVKQEEATNVAANVAKPNIDPPRKA